MIGEEIKVFFIALEEKGITEIQISYDGSGDSGSVDNVSFFDANDDEIELSDFESKAKDFGYHILEKYYEIDWYNNEGGHGVISINIPEKTWEIDGYYRETQSIEAGDSGDLETALNSFKQ